jgi:hypothetical protein
MGSVRHYGRVERERPSGDDPPDRPTAQRPDGRDHPQEDFSIRRAGAYRLEIAYDGFANRRGERIRLRPSPLGAGDEEEIPLPVHVVQLETPHFDRAQSVNCEEQQDRTVSDIYRPISLCGGNQALHVIPERTPRQAFASINPWRCHGCCQSLGTPPSAVGIPNKATQIGDIPSDCPPSISIIAPLASDCFIQIDDRELTQGLMVAKEPLQKILN